MLCIIRSAGTWQDRGWTLLQLGKITFEDPDPETFLGLKYALEAAKTGEIDADSV